MAFDSFTALLNSSDFPFTSDFFQRTITIPGLDLPPRAGRIVTGTEEGNNKELPQQFYCQNVLPTTEGLLSVGYNQQVGAVVGASDFDQIITLRDEDENNFLFSPARGKNYIFRADIGSWVQRNSFIGWTGDIVSRSYVNGRTFVHYEKYKIFEYNTAADTFDEQVLTGINATDIDCIGSAQNYNIAVTGITVNWSSLIDPLDFVPSLQTGAGAAIPQDMKGIGRAVVPISGGFIIYTSKNAVAALYTNNARAPFVFREVSNAGGITRPEDVSYDASLGYHYAWTTNGLQKIGVSGAESVSAAATDFLAGRIFEEFDLATLTFNIQRLTTQLKTKIAYVAGRYIIISYGKETAAPQVYTHAIVQDIALKRWGKLRVDHVDCFSYPYPNILGQVSQTPPKQVVAFLKKTGQVDLLVMDYRDRADQGVLLLGRYQLVRQKMATFQTLELEGLQQGYPPSVYLAISADGRNNSAFAPLTELASGGGSMKKYGAPAPDASGVAAPRTGKNFSILVTGTFELNTALITLTRQGNR